MTPNHSVPSNVFASCVCAVLLLCGAAGGAEPPTAATQPTRKMSNAEIRRGLMRELPRAQFHASLSDAIDFMHDVTGLSFDVQWDKLKVVGITEKTPVTLAIVKQTKMRDILTAILTSAGGKPGALDYAIVDGRVVIGPTNPPTTQPK